MARVRPIKLHIKDGKDSAFRLIGPKGRVLNMLKWDGSALQLSDESSVEEIEQSPNEDNSGEEGEFLKNDDPQTTGEEDLSPADSDQEITNAGDEEELAEELVDSQENQSVPAVADEPEPKEDTKDEDAPLNEVEDVSGESETAGLINDDSLSEFLEDEASNMPTDKGDEEDDDTVSLDSKSDDVEEKKPKD